MGCMKQTTLAIESTCDDSSVALVTYDQWTFVVEEMITHTQGMHAKFGGVVPEYASREHAVWLPKLVQQILEDGREFDTVTVAASPGLPWSLVAGITTAHILAHTQDTPLQEVNHIMGHVFSILLDRNIDILQLPYLCLTVSWWHSDIYMVESWKLKVESRDASQRQPESDKIWHKRKHVWIGESVMVGPYEVTKLVQTMDDAVGEAYDKVAKMLWGPYPGGPWLDGLTQSWESDEENIHMIKNRIRKIDISDQFSFSGIKAQVYSLLEYLKREGIACDEQMQRDIATVFQDRIVDALVQKVENIISTTSPKTLGIVGGVSANSSLKEKTALLAQKYNIWVYMPHKMSYCADNAAMIGVVGLLEEERRN